MAANLNFLKDERVQKILNTLDDTGHSSLVVGGAARDGLRGIKPKDIDVATSATPDEVEKIFSKHDDVSMRPTGLDHGTWTAVIGEMPIEITTFRKDVSTDGRRATVAWAQTFEEDATRRDFTFNALGLTKDGTILDPTGQGLDDLKNGQVRFVGNAQERCDEDALRVLRLFRFQGRMGSWPMNQNALKAAENTSLEHLSGERIWSEMKGILQTPQADKVLGAMHDTGVWQRLLPKTPINIENSNGLAHVMKREEEAGLEPHWGRRLYAVSNGRSRFPWPLSGKEAKRLTNMSKTPYPGDPLKTGAATQSTQAGVDTWTLGTQKNPTPQKDAKIGATTPFPVTGQDMISAGVKPGPKMGKILSQFKKDWIETDLSLKKEEMLSKIESKKIYQTR